MNKNSTLILYLLFGLTVGEAAEPRQRLIRFYARNHKWEVGAQACLKGRVVTYACGRIVRVSQDQVLLRVFFTGEERLQRGDSFRVVEVPRQMQSDGTSFERVRTGKTAPDVSISAGVAGSVNYLFPEVQLGIAVSDNVSLGALVVVAPSKRLGREVSIYGAFAIAQVYSGETCFSGLGMEAGAGFYSFQINDGSQLEKLVVPAFQLTGAWGFVFQNGISLRLRAGVQSFVKAESNLLDLGLNGAQPLVGAQLGYAF